MRLSSDGLLWLQPAHKLGHGRVLEPPGGVPALALALAPGHAQQPEPANFAPPQPFPATALWPGSSELVPPPGLLPSH